MPSLLSKQDVICLDSSGEEDEQEEPQLPVRPIREGMIEERKRLSFFLFFTIMGATVEAQNIPDSDMW